MNRRGVTILLIVLVTVFALTAAGLGIAWGITSKSARAENNRLGGTLENIYQQSYYELTYNISNIATSLNKLLISNSVAMQRKLLDDLSAYSASAVTNLASVLAENTNAEKVMKYINQVGDYSSYLLFKLANGETLSLEDRDNITSIYVTLLAIEEALDEVKEEVETRGYVFLENLGTANDVIGNMLDGLESSDIQYPTLIYDGPFSAALETKEPKGLIGEEIDAASGEAKVREYLNGHTVNSIEYLGEGTNHFSVLMYRADTELGEANIEVAKRGGGIVMMNILYEVNEPEHDETACVGAASSYLADIGYPNMSAVWVSNYNSTMYVNFAYVQNGVILYPDLIKVKVAADNMAIVGVEALSYAFNHREREGLTPAITEIAARNAISVNITIQSVRLAIVPTDGETEKLVYEVYGTTNEDKYFIYIDALTGDEINILRVIDSDKGMLLV